MDLKCQMSSGLIGLDGVRGLLNVGLEADTGAGDKGRPAVTSIDTVAVRLKSRVSQDEKEDGIG
jgi:hypothetical protein